MKYQAHRGVSTEAPENTMPAIELAVAQGYQVIEMDVDVTKDMRFVLLHDRSLGRTARNTDGSVLENAPEVFNITYEEMQKYDFGIWFAKKYEGVRAPLLSSVLDYARQSGVKAKIDNKYRFFDAEQRAAFYAILSDYQEVAELTCFTLEDLKEAAEALPEMSFHYDGVVSEDILKELSLILPKERLTVWVPIENKCTWWVRVAYADKALADMIKPYAKLGLWIISSYADAEFAQSLGADIVETNGLIKPTAKKGVVADMHTHSEHSHDSVCPIEDMVAAHIDKGANVMAVTDHFDTHSYGVYDIHTPIRKGHEDIDRLHAAGVNCRLLKGVELGEAFWNDEAYRGIRSLHYDVIIGSVHVIKYDEGYCIYSRTDFSALPTEKIYELIDAYFDDMLTMLDTVDFDILAHLTCPLRYIVGKHKREVDLSRFDEKITTILERIIKRGIALEINTASYGILGEIMPCESIIRKYYEMGGYLITVGSDAHVARNACVNFEPALRLLKEIGFKHLYYYENRRPIPYEI